MQWFLAKTKGMLIARSINDKLAVGPSKFLYAADLAEGRLDTDVLGYYMLLLAVAGLLDVVALYECHKC
jgi:hypothetical protein